VTRPQHSNAACWPDRCLGSLRWIVAGVVWHGITIRTLQRIWLQLIERLSGPMAFRFILQPLMAAVAAILHGRKDAQTGAAFLGDDKRTPRTGQRDCGKD